MHDDRPPTDPAERYDPLTKLNVVNEIVAFLEDEPGHRTAPRRVRQVEALVREIDLAGYPLMSTERRRIARALAPFTIVEPVVLAYMALDLAERLPLCAAFDLANEKAVVEYLTAHKLGEPYRPSLIDQHIEAICDAARALRQRAAMGVRA